MEIFNDQQRDGLRYIEAANSGGYQPTAGEVNEWVLKRGRRPARRGPLIEPSKPSPMRVGLEQALAPQMRLGAALREQIDGIARVSMDRLLAQAREAGIFSYLDFTRTPARYGPGTPAESYVDHMIRLGWLGQGEAGGLLLAPLGKALLRDDTFNNGGGADAAVVILEAGSDLAYPQLIGHIADSGEAFVIDPYAMADHVWQLIEQTATSRVLIGPYVRPNKLAELKVLLGTASRPIEVRQAPTGLLHDRFIIGDQGVHTVGASWNSVGKSLTLLSPLPQIAADRIIDAAEEWWDKAAAVEPSTPRPQPRQTEEASD